MSARYPERREPRALGRRRARPKARRLRSSRASSIGRSPAADRAGGGGWAAQSMLRTSAGAGANSTWSPDQSSQPQTPTWGSFPQYRSGGAILSPVGADRTHRRRPVGTTRRGGSVVGIEAVELREALCTLLREVRELGLGTRRAVAHGLSAAVHGAQERNPVPGEPGARRLAPGTGQHRATV